MTKEVTPERVLPTDVLAAYQDYRAEVVARTETLLGMASTMCDMAVIGADELYDAIRDARQAWLTDLENHLHTTMFSHLNYQQLMEVSEQLNDIRDSLNSGDREQAAIANFIATIEDELKREFTGRLIDNLSNAVNGTGHLVAAGILAAAQGEDIAPKWRQPVAEALRQLAGIVESTAEESEGAA